MLTRCLACELPVDCSGHFHVANLRSGLVVVLAESPAWATRLRQLSPEILAILQQCGHGRLLHVRVISRPGNQPVRASRVPARVKHERCISPESSSLITRAAAGIEDDGLRAALLKLAAHGTSRGTTKK